MNLNAREKLILVVVLVVVLWIAGIITFIKPSIDDMKSAQNTLDKKKIELAEKQERIRQDENLKEDIRNAYNKVIETGEVFYPKMVQHDAGTVMQDLLDIDGDDKNGQELKNDNMSISTMNKANLTKYVYTPTEVQATLEKIAGQMDPEQEVKKAKPNVSSLTAYNFSTHFIATKEDCQTFMENLINNEHKSMVINSFSVSDVGDNDEKAEWNCSMELTMFMIPTLKDPDIVNAQIESGVTVNALSDISE
jgi:hypothetical protein